MNRLRRWLPYLFCLLLPWQALAASGSAGCSHLTRTSAAMANMHGEDHGHGAMNAHPSLAGAGKNHAACGCAAAGTAAGCDHCSHCQGGIGALLVAVSLSGISPRGADSVPAFDEVAVTRAPDNPQRPPTLA